MTVENCQFKGYLPTFNVHVSVRKPSLIPGGHLERDNWKRVGRSPGLLHSAGGLYSGGVPRPSKYP